MNISLTERLKLRFLVQIAIRGKDYEKYDFFGNSETNFIAYMNHITEFFKYDTWANYRVVVDFLLFRNLKLHIYKADDIIRITKTLCKTDTKSAKNKFDDLARMALMYNDTVLFDTLDKDILPENIKFLHGKSDFGETMLKHYMKDFQFNAQSSNFNKLRLSKVLTLFKEILKLFSLADNGFSEDFEKFTNEVYHIVYL
jgi:hypothetical protein